MNNPLTSLHTLAVLAILHQMILIGGMVSLGIAVFGFIRNASTYMRAMANAKQAETKRRYSNT